MSFPRAASEVTAAWVEAAVGAERGSLETVELDRIGNGLMGENLRLSLRWGGARCDDGTMPPASLVVKFASADPTSRATGISTRTYEREIRFYREIAPRTPIRTARCFAAEIDEDSGEFALLLEDLAPAEVGDQLRGCSIGEARLAIDVAADLHAAWWDAADLASFDWLSSTDDATRGAQLAALWQLAWPMFLDRHSGEFRGAQLGVGERFGNAIEMWIRSRRGPATITHGDFRVDNLLFASGPTPWMVPVDWQTPAIGTGIGDVAYFLGASLTTGDRRRVEADLVGRWRDRLAMHGIAYDADRCWIDYRHAAFGGVLMAVAASMLAQQTDRGDRMFATMFDRHTNAVLDLEAIDLIG